jgi:hypothetical protein
VLVLGIGLAVLVMLLVSVVVDASRAFLARRALAGLADGTALQAAHAVDLAALYESQPAGSLPLADAAARRGAATYVASHALAAGVPSARLVAVTVDGPTVRVTLTMTDPATLAASLLGGGSAQHLTVTASASSEVMP